MGKYERRVWFERLCELKAIYQAEAAYENVAIHALDETIEGCIWLLDEALVESTASDEQAA
jgi:hypothetical protein